MAEPSEESQLAQVDELAKPSPGGTLAHLVEYWKSLGHEAVISADAKQAFIPGVRGEQQRFPLACVDAPPQELLKSVLSQNGVRLATYLVEPGEQHIANCFDYVCANPQYCIDSLDKNGRRDVRRGLRTFRVRLCTWDELAEKGFDAVADTTARHGYVSADRSWLDDLIARQRGTPFYEIWGAWDGPKLAAWMTLIKIDDWAIVDIARSCTDALKGCPNNAICYAATSRLLTVEKRKFVTYGLSSIQVDVDERAMHHYKLRMGYQGLPRCRVFAAKGALGMMLRSKAFSSLCEKLAKRRPHSATLKKLAGMSRLTSGREANPLAWAQEEA